MISSRLHIALIVAVIIYFLALGVLLKRNRFLLKYSLIWIFAGIVMLIFAIFPKLLNSLSRFLGIYNPVNALFIMVLCCVVCVLVSLTAIVSAMNEKIKRLTQNQAILEEKIKELSK